MWKDLNYYIFIINNWYNLLFIGVKKVYDDLVNIIGNLEELKIL